MRSRTTTPATAPGRGTSSSGGTAAGRSCGVRPLPPAGRLGDAPGDEAGVRPLRARQELGLSVASLWRAFCALLVVLALAACAGGEDGGSAGAAQAAADGGATLWVTRETGAEVVVTAQVPAGDSALQALDRHADVETLYGGRFVQAVNGLGGAASTISATGSTS